MAQHHLPIDPIFVEIGLEADKLPAGLNGRIKSKRGGGEEALVAHFPMKPAN